MKDVVFPVHMKGFDTYWISRKDILKIEPFDFYDNDGTIVSHTVITLFNDEELFVKETVACILGMMNHNDPGYFAIVMHHLIRGARGSVKNNRAVMTRYAELRMEISKFMNEVLQ